MKSEVLENLDADALSLELVPDVPPPCVIKPTGRAEVCGRTDEHPANWEVLWSCGCCNYYCDSAWRFFQRWSHNIDCMEICGVPSIHPVSMERIR